MEVQQLLSRSVVTISGDANVRQGAISMDRAGVGSLAVLEQGEFIGIFTERDVLGAVALGTDLDREVVSRWMTDHPDALSPDVDVVDAAGWLVANGYRHLPVVENGSLVGVASIKDVLWAVTSQKR